MSGGSRGKCPDWFRLIEAARHLGVPPWKLAKKPVHWRELSLEALEAKSWAEAERSKRRRGHG